MQSLYLSPYAVKMLQNEAIIALTVTYEWKIPIAFYSIGIPVKKL